MNKLLNLLSNGHGTQSFGLMATCRALLPLGEIIVIAPAIKYTATGRVGSNPVGYNVTAQAVYQEFSG